MTTNHKFSTIALAMAAAITLSGEKAIGATAECGTYKSIFESSKEKNECLKTFTPLGTLTFDNNDLTEAAKKAFGKDITIPYSFAVDPNTPEVIGFKKIVVKGESPFGKQNKMDKLWFNGSTFVVGGIISPEQLRKKKAAHGKYGDFIGWRLVNENGEPILGLEKNGTIIGGMIIPLLNQDAVTVFSEMAAWQQEIKEGKIDFPNKKIISRNIMERIKREFSITTGNKGGELYIFHDPFCHFCKRLYSEIRPLTREGKVTVHWIEIGALGENSLKAAMWLDSQGTAEALDRWEERGQMPMVFSGSKELKARAVGATRLFEEAGGMGTPFIVMERKNGTGVALTGYVNPQDLIEFQQNIDKK